MRTLEQIQDNWRQYGLEYTTPFPDATDFLANGQVVCRHHRHVDVPYESWYFEDSVLTTRGLHLVGGLLNNFLMGREPVSLSILDFMHLWEELGGIVTDSRFYYDGVVVAEMVFGDVISFEGKTLKSEIDMEDLMTTCEDLTLHEAVNDLVLWWRGEGGRCDQNGHSFSFTNSGILHSETLGDFWIPGTIAVWEADKMLMGDALLCSDGTKKCTIAELRALLEASLCEYSPKPEPRKSLEDIWGRTEGGEVDDDRLVFKGVKVCEWDAAEEIFKGPEGQKIWNHTDFWDLLLRARKVCPDAPGLMAEIREEWLTAIPHTDIYEEGDEILFVWYEDVICRWWTWEALSPAPILPEQGQEITGGLPELQTFLRSFIEEDKKERTIQEAQKDVSLLEQVVRDRELDLKVAKLALEAAERRLSDVSG